MVEPYSVEHAFLQQAEDEAMGMVEHFRDLDADSGKLVDVEEAAVVDVVGRDTEMRRPPVLLFDQRVELAPAFEIAGSPVETIHGFRD